MILLIGESGSGKTTILNEIVKRGYQKAINYTTRKRRTNEKENDEYCFVTKKEFEKLWNEGKLLQRAEFNQELYGIGSQCLKKDVVCISIVKSVYDIKQKATELGLEDIPIQTFYIWVPEEQRVQRMLQRGDTIEQIEKRIQIDTETFKEARNVADSVIENQNLQQAVEEIIKKASV